MLILLIFFFSFKGNDDFTNKIQTAERDTDSNSQLIRTLQNQIEQMKSNFHFFN